MPRSSPDATFASAQDHAACKAAIRTGSKSFFAASMVLPAAVRQPAYGLYAFCRMSDDAIDLHGGSLQALVRLQDRLARIYDGRPLPIAADRAMADLVRDFEIPAAVPEALLEGLAWDAQGRRYDTIQDLHDYAARVAGTVGAMMALIMGVRSPEALARACDLGIAMQLTNIARDIGEDARAGRLYLPVSWMRDASLDPAAFLADPRTSPALCTLTKRLLDDADDLYARARSGIAHLPAGCRPAILAAGLIYAEIGREIEQHGFDSIDHRAHVPTSRKVHLLARAVAGAPFLARGTSRDSLGAVDFLLAAIGPRMNASVPPQAARRLRPQFIRVLEIFERLERAEQFGD
jgi:phytoene synthase